MPFADSSQRVIPPSRLRWMTFTDGTPAEKQAYCVHDTLLFCPPRHRGNWQPSIVIFDKVKGSQGDPAPFPRRRCLRLIQHTKTVFTACRSRSVMSRFEGNPLPSECVVSMMILLASAAITPTVCDERVKFARKCILYTNPGRVCLMTAPNSFGALPEVPQTMNAGVQAVMTGIETAADCIGFSRARPSIQPPPASAKRIMPACGTVGRDTPVIYLSDLKSLFGKDFFPGTPLISFAKSHGQL